MLKQACQSVSHAQFIKKSMMNCKSRAAVDQLEQRKQVNKVRQVGAGELNSSSLVPPRRKLIR